MNKYITLSGLLVVTVSCSPSSPTSGQLSYQYPHPDIYFSGELLEFDPKIIPVLREFEEVYKDIGGRIETGTEKIDLSPFEDEEFTTAIANFRSLTTEQEDLRRANLRARLDEAKTSAAELSIALAKSEAVKAEFESYTKEYTDQIKENQAALEAAQAEQRKLSPLIVERTNAIIVERKLPIEKLSPRVKVLSWSTSTWRDGVDLSQVSCQDDEPSLTLDRIEIDGSCVYAERPIPEVVSEEYDAFLMSSLSTYIDLDKVIGEGRTYYRAATGLQGIISDLKAELENAEIVARNQTDTTFDDISWEVSRTQEKVQDLEAEISQYERDLSSSALLGFEYDEPGYRRPSGLNVNYFVRDSIERTLKSIADDHLTSRVEIARDGSFEGLDSNAGLLVRFATIHGIGGMTGYEQNFHIVSDETNTESDDSGEYRIRILEDEAYRGRRLLDIAADDRLLIESQFMLMDFAQQNEKAE